MAHMVQTFSTNSSQDIFIGSDGNLSVSTGLQGVIDACETATYAQLHEMVLANNLGMPNYQTIWIGQPNYPIWNLYLRNTLESVAGVNSVKNIQISRGNNILNYTATIKTDFGTTTISGSVTRG